MSHTGSDRIEMAGGGSSSRDETRRADTGLRRYEDGEAEAEEVLSPTKSKRELSDSEVGPCMHCDGAPLIGASRSRRRARTSRNNVRPTAAW